MSTKKLVENAEGQFAGLSRLLLGIDASALGIGRQLIGIRHLL